MRKKESEYKAVAALAQQIKKLERKNENSLLKKQGM